MNNQEVEEKKLKYEDEISMDDLHAYKQQGFLARIPYWIKAVLLKYWFYGAICFFVLMGLGGAGANGENGAIVCGLIAGLVFDFIVYGIYRAMDSDKKESRYYVMYKSKKIWSVFVNIPYQLLVFILGMLIMTSIVATYKDPVNNWFLQEPFSQALVLTALDAVFVLIKNLLVYLFRKKIKRK